MDLKDGALKSLKITGNMSKEGGLITLLIRHRAI